MQCDSLDLAEFSLLKISIAGKYFAENNYKYLFKHGKTSRGKTGRSLFAQGWARGVPGGEGGGSAQGAPASTFPVGAIPFSRQRGSPRLLPVSL